MITILSGIAWLMIAAAFIIATWADRQTRQMRMI